MNTANLVEIFCLLDDFCKNYDGTEKHYITPMIRTLLMDVEEFIAISGGDIHGPGDQPPVKVPSEWDTRELELVDMFEFKW